MLFARIKLHINSVDSPLFVLSSLLDFLAKLNLEGFKDGPDRVHRLVSQGFTLGQVAKCGLRRRLRAQVHLLVAEV